VLHWTLARGAPGSPEIKKDDLPSLVFDLGLSFTENFVYVFYYAHRSSNIKTSADFNLSFSNLSECVGDFFVQKSGQGGIFEWGFSFNLNEGLDLLLACIQDVHDLCDDLGASEPFWVIMVCINLAQSLKDILLFVFSNFLTYNSKANATFETSFDPRATLIRYQIWGASMNGT